MKNSQETLTRLPQTLPNGELFSIPVSGQANHLTSLLMGSKENFLGLPFSLWVRFCHSMVVGELTEITPAGKLGMFGANSKRLCELGVMGALRLVHWGTRKVWMGEFAPPLSMENFLMDSKKQYEIFELDLRDRYHRISGSSLEHYYGVAVDRDPVTLSGLLALTYSAGIRGAKRWLANESDRSRYPNTTINFGKANGIF